MKAIRCADLVRARIAKIDRLIDFRSTNAENFFYNAIKPRIEDIDQPAIHVELQQPIIARRRHPQRSVMQSNVMNVRAKRVRNPVLQLPPRTITVDRVEVGDEDFSIAHGDTPRAARPAAWIGIARAQQGFRDSHDPCG